MKMMSPHARPRMPWFSSWLVLAASLLLVCFGSNVASADTAVLSRNGTLYEVFIAPYRDVVAGASVVRYFAAQDYPVVGLRTTAPDGNVALEVVDGTFTSEPKGLPSVAVDETTGAVIVCYSKYQGLMSDLHVAVQRDGLWVGQDIAANPGLYLSLNPQMTATRQQYLAFDGKGGTVTKSRTIFSLVWWEESGLSQARYAPIFVEDGVLAIGAVVAFDLNDLMGHGGSTDISGLPSSSYMFPAVQGDPASTNGGVLISFANLVTRREQVISVTFPADLTKLSGASSPGGFPDAQVRSHVPVGRELGDGPILMNRDTQVEVGYFIAPTGRATSWWVDSTGLRYIQNDAAATDQPKTLLIRPDFPVDRALNVIREMTFRN